MRKQRTNTVNDELDTGHRQPSAAEAHQVRQRVASSHAALLPTRLALARWRHGGDLPHLHEGSPPLRAAWYARAVREYQAWLDRGGFAQHDDFCPLSSPPPPPDLVRPAPDGDTQHLGACT